MKIRIDQNGKKWITEKIDTESFALCTGCLWDEYFPCIKPPENEEDNKTATDLAMILSVLN